MSIKTVPDSLKLQIRKKNGQYYTYTSTSRMVDGKKKTINKYAGKYNPMPRS